VIWGDWTGSFKVIRRQMATSLFDTSHARLHIRLPIYLSYTDVV